MFVKKFSVSYPIAKIIGLFAAQGLVWILYRTGIGCVFRYFTGIPCPGCGMTRAVVLLLRGELVAATHQHFMVWSLPILCLYLFCDGRIFRNKRVDIAILCTIGIGFLLHWIFLFVPL